jgi:hypothetical protein
MCESETRAVASPFDEESQLRVFEVDFRTDPRWISFVGEHPNGSIYHHPVWLRSLEKEYQQNFVSLACVDGSGQFRAILPLAYTRGMPFGFGGPQAARRLSSLPRTPVCGSLAMDPLAEAAVVRAAVERIRQAPGSCLQLKARESRLHEHVDGLIHTPWRFTYILKLPDRLENLRFGNSRNHTRIMWSVHKASKLGVRVRLADTVADLKAWYKVYLETMRRNVVPPRSYRFFLSLWESMRPLGLLRLMLAELDAHKGRRLLAGSLFLKFGQTVHYAFNGARRESFPLRPNDLIQWQAIQNSCEDGFRWFDFGEVPEGNTQLAEFKSKWGAQPIPLHRYYYPKASLAGVDVSRPGGYSKRLAMELWRRLPLTATSWLGDAIYAYM